ncbi:MAG: branched-chain amino acid transaminase [Candidatus Hydrogenedentota bacterium]|nr:MAG: branched-chain amino acid transaminase [Candidatus Hydrogenedentota bacterium]
MTDYDLKPCYFEGKFIPLKDANLNIRTHALQYGTACFGGIRGYWNENKQNLFLFRIEDHYKRLKQSAKILQMQTNYSIEEYKDITLQLLQKGHWKENVYLRPFLYKSALELSPRLHNVQDSFALYAIPLGDYLDTQKGLKVCVSSWIRISDNQIPTRAKANGGYINSALAKSEALQNGYEEAIFLDSHGNVSEGSAENLFLVRDGVLITPDVSSSILEGITRRSLLQLAKDFQIPIEVRPVDRTELYVADEAFFAGTGVQVAWIREIDHRIIGNGKIGTITKKLQDTFFEIVTGENDAYSHWITPVY